MSDGMGFQSVVFLVAIGLLFAGLGGYMWTEQNEAIRTHESTEATVVSAEVKLDEGTADTSDQFYPAVTYEYTVGGETYRSSNVLPGPGRQYRGKDWAKKVVENHPPGEETTVYYDPENPASAFLVEDRSLWPLAFVGTGGVAVLGGLYGLGKRFAGLVS